MRCFQFRNDAEVFHIARVALPLGGRVEPVILEAVMIVAVAAIGICLHHAADGGHSGGIEGKTEMAVEPFDRAWRRVGLALDRIGFTVQDQNREKGLYYVRYADPEAEMDQKDKRSFLSRLAFWRSNSDKAKPEQYQVQVKQVNDGSQVRVLNKDGVAEKSETAGKILALLHDQLK